MNAFRLDDNYVYDGKPSAYDASRN
jgi:hypothetical protein